MHRPLMVSLVAALALAVTATAAAAVLSGTYTGTLAPPRTDISITLTVNSGQAKAAISNTPVYCSGGGGPLPFTFKATKIGTTGAFTVKGIERIKVGPRKGQIGERFTLTGRFTAHGTVAGKLATVYPSFKACGGSSRFTARA